MIITKNTKTKYPQQIDDRIFFQDVNILQVPIMNNYYTLLNNGNYSMASEYLNDSEVFFYGAWVLNLFENRLYEIGNFTVNILPKNILTHYHQDEPTDTYDGMNWIE